MAFLYETVKFVRVRLSYRRMLVLKPSYSAAPLDASSTDNDFRLMQQNRDFSQRMFPIWTFIVLALLYIFQVTLGYFLMLVVMSYNTFLFIAAVCGLAAGYCLYFGLQTNMTYAHSIGVGGLGDSCCQ